MARPQFAIVGSGRSGTGFMAALMKANGLHWGHEEYYNPIRLEGDDQDESLMGDSSWLALPYLESEPYGRVIHVTREPIAVVRSLLSIRFFHPETEDAPYPQFLRRYSEVFQHADPVVRAVEFWVEWNRRCAAVAEVSMKIEELDYRMLSEILSSSIQPRGLDQRINHIPESLTIDYGSDSTPESSLLEYFCGRQKDFGY